MHVWFDGIPELENDFRRVAAGIRNATRHATITAAREGIALAKSSHRYEDRTGELTSTAEAKRGADTDTRSEAFMVWPAKYASFVEDGTPRHEIVGNPWLHFWWNGVEVFLPHVDHPGNKPYGFAGDAYLKAERVLWRELELQVQRKQSILDERGLK